MFLPENPGKDRESAILNYVINGEYQVSFSTVLCSYKEHIAQFNVFSDAMKINGVRVNVSAETQQKIADILDCSLLTPKLADLIWSQRNVSVEPFPMLISATTTSMIEHSTKIDRALKLLGTSEGIISTVGKHWVIVKNSSPNKAINYGWHFKGNKFKGISGTPCVSKMKKDGKIICVIQGVGTAHDIYHTDYSQTCVLVQKKCIVDNTEANLLDIFKDPELTPLII